MASHPPKASPLQRPPRPSTAAPDQASNAAAAGPTRKDAPSGKLVLDTVLHDNSTLAHVLYPLALRTTRISLRMSHLAHYSQSHPP